MGVSNTYTRTMTEFIKRNATSFPDALIWEAEGLRLLTATLRKANQARPGALQVPDVIRVSASELVLPRIHDRSGSREQMAALGKGLARMHRQKMPCYGLDHDNLIGLSRQFNVLKDDWGAFFLDYRLKPQIRMIADSRVKAEFESRLAANASALRGFLNHHCPHPSLLHGDLWAGNMLFDQRGPWLIDPAVYYGDREVDLAMTELFGGFSPAFYQAYDSVYPRSEAYGMKRPIYNLYHTLNHYNLFGGSYLGACRHNLGVLDQL